jgi:hypothetical protein
MQEIVINVGQVSKDDVLKIFDTLHKLLTFGKGIAAFTPTMLDDKVLRDIDEALLWLQPLLQKDGILDIINFIVNLLNRGKNSDEIVAALNKEFEMA